MKLLVLEPIHEGWRLRRAWWFTATARSRARFARTILGSFWLGLSNVLSIAVLGFVYATVFQVEDFRQYMVYLGTGMLSWGLIASAISSAPALLEGNARQIMNSNIHPIFYTLEEWSFQVQTFAQSLSIVLVGLTFFEPKIIWNLVSSGLLPLANLLIFCYWLPLLICLLGVRFKDLYQLIPILLQLVFLLSPILYEKKSLGNLQWITEINPLYIALSQFRHALVHGETGLVGTTYFMLFNLGGVIVSVLILQRSKASLPLSF